jgi:hypothetical protein
MYLTSVYLGLSERRRQYQACFFYEVEVVLDLKVLGLLLLVVVGFSLA